MNLPPTIEIPGLGVLKLEREYGWYNSEPMPVGVMGESEFSFSVEGYESDDRKEDFDTAIANFLAAPPSVLLDASEAVFKYYHACKDYWGEISDIKSANDVWRHVNFGYVVAVKRRPYGDRGIYLSITGACEWEQEHGLEIVFKNGLRVNKVGAYDECCTNSDAFGGEDRDDVVFAG